MKQVDFTVNTNSSLTALLVLLWILGTALPHGCNWVFAFCFPPWAWTVAVRYFINFL